MTSDAVAAAFKALEEALADPSLDGPMRYDRARKLAGEILEHGLIEDMDRLFRWAAATSSLFYGLVGDLYEEILTYGHVQREGIKPFRELHLIVVRARHFGELPSARDIIAALPPSPSGKPLGVAVERLFSFDEIWSLDVSRKLHTLVDPAAGPLERAAMFGPRSVNGVYDPVTADSSEAFLSCLFLPCFVPTGQPIFDSSARAAWTEEAAHRLGSMGIFPRAPRRATEALFQAVCDAISISFDSLLDEARRRGTSNPLLGVEYLGYPDTDISLLTRLTLYEGDTGEWVVRQEVPQALPSDRARWRNNAQQIGAITGYPVLFTAPNIQPFDLSRNGAPRLALHVWFGPPAAFKDAEPPDGLIAGQDGTFPEEHQQWIDYDREDLKDCASVIIDMLRELVRPDLPMTSTEFYGCHSAKWYPSTLIDLGVRGEARVSEVRATLGPVVNGVIAHLTFVLARKWAHWELLPREAETTEGASKAGPGG